MFRIVATGCIGCRFHANIVEVHNLLLAGQISPMLAVTRPSWGMERSCRRLQRRHRRLQHLAGMPIFPVALTKLCGMRMMQLGWAAPAGQRLLEPMMLPSDDVAAAAMATSSTAVAYCFLCGWQPLYRTVRCWRCLQVFDPVTGVWSETGGCGSSSARLCLCTCNAQAGEEDSVVCCHPFWPTTAPDRNLGCH